MPLRSQIVAAVAVAEADAAVRGIVLVGNDRPSRLART